MAIPAGRWASRLVVPAIVVAAFLIGRSMGGNTPATTEHADHAGQAAEAATIWTCSMHPQIRLPEPGQCPICGMDLIPLKPDAGGGEAGPRSMTLSPAAQRIAEVEVTPAERRDVRTTLRVVGKLEADETRTREISAWVAGRIDRLYIDATGVAVRQGQELFDLYSPELYSAQEELLQAIRASEALSRSALESTRDSAPRTVQAARERLRLWGLTARQVEAIEQRGAASDHVTITAPMSGIVMHKDAVEGTYVKKGQHVYAIADLSMLWLQLDVYEADLSWIQVGDPVEFETDAYRGETFPGQVVFIDPVLDERSRSVKVRVNVENPHGRLKPGMFARAVVHSAIPGDDDGPPLVIPRSAPLVTGKRAVVYVEDPDLPGRYQGREIVLGPEADDVVVVRRGLAEGELVVTNGAFKIDSALQIQAKDSMMSAPAADEGGKATSEVAGVPPRFHEQMDGVMTAYFAMKDALAHDDVAAAKDAAGRVKTALEKVDHGLVPASGHQAWMDAQRAMLDAAAAVVAAADLDAARGPFETLSDALIETVQTFGASGSTPVLVYHCPMVRGGIGADWLQDREGTENPYYGSRMFRCGSLTATLAAGRGAADGE